MKNKRSEYTRCELSRVGGTVSTVVAIILLSGCATAPNHSVAQVPASQPREINPAERGPVSGMGIESQDVVAVTDRMARDMLANATLAGRASAPRVIIDSAYFENDSSHIINKNVITDRLRINLNRASAGRLVFVGREFARAVAEERALKREGVTDIGTTGLTRGQAGADFRLGGRITTLDSRDGTGQLQRYTQITFSMFDLETGVLVWEGIYEFTRAGADDVMYR